MKAKMEHHPTLSTRNTCYSWSPEKRMHPMNNPMLCKLLLAICVALLVSCNAYPSVTQDTPIPIPSPTQTDSAFRYDWKNNWLNNATCAPPCWEGITPGRTSLQDTMEILANLPGARIISPTKTGVQWAGSQSYNGYAGTAEGSSIVQFLSIRFNHNQNISLEEALGVFGEPIKVQSNNCVHGGCDVFMIYPESGLALMIMSTSMDNTVEIDKLSDVQGLIFFSPGIDNYLKMIPFQGFEVREWEGYGTYPE